MRLLTTRYMVLSGKILEGPYLSFHFQKLRLQQWAEKRLLGGVARLLPQDWT